MLSTMTHSLKKTLIICLFLTQAHNVQAFDLLTFVCGYILVETVVAPSTETKQYEKLHRFLQNQSEDYFSDEIALIQNGNIDLALSKHEYYRHYNFLAAIKKTCPGYCAYIKSLKNKLDTDFQARVVKGFEPTRQGLPILRYARKMQDTDEYPFYELIKKLYADVIRIESRREKEVLFLLNAQPVVRLT